MINQTKGDIYESKYVKHGPKNTNPDFLYQKQANAYTVATLDNRDADSSTLAICHLYLDTV